MSSQLSDEEDAGAAIERTLEKRSSAQNFDEAFASLASPTRGSAAAFKAAKAAAIASPPAGSISLDVEEGSLKEYDEQGHLKWLEQFGVGGEEESNAVVSGVGKKRSGESRASTSTTTVVTSTSTDTSEWWSTVPIGLTVDHPHRGLGTVTGVNEGGSARVVVQYAIGGKPQTCDETVWRALLRESKAIRARSAKLVPNPLRGGGGGRDASASSTTVTTTTRASSERPGEESAADAVQRRMGGAAAPRRSEPRRTVELSALTHRSPPRSSARSALHGAHHASSAARDALGMSHDRWEAKRDGATSKIYYSRAATGEVCWSEPEGWSPFFNTLALGYSVPAPPVPRSGTLVVRTREGAAEKANVVNCADDPRCGGGEGQRCCSGGSGGSGGGDGDGSFGRTDEEENDGSCGAPETIPHPDGHCIRCGCLLVGKCRSSLGIAWSCLLLLLGVVVFVRAFYLVGVGIAIITLYADRKGIDANRLAIDNTCFNQWGTTAGYCNSDRWSSRIPPRKTCDLSDDGTFCWRRCCTDDDQWLLPMVYLEGYQDNRGNLYFSSFRSAFWLLVYGALLVVFSLAHPKVACSKRKEGRRCRNAMWVMDPLTRIGGLGALLLFVACSPGGGNIPAMRTWFSVFTVIGVVMILLAVIDSLFHFLPQPLPLIAACGCCGCSSSTRVGGSDLEENEGATDFADDSKACTLCWCGACSFKGGTLWTLCNIVVALGSVPQSVLLTPVWTWTYEGALAMAVTTAALLVATSIVFVSIITPKRMWRPLWFFDPLRSLFGLGCVRPVRVSSLRCLLTRQARSRTLRSHRILYSPLPTPLPARLRPHVRSTVACNTLQMHPRRASPRCAYLYLGADGNLNGLLLFYELLQHGQVLDGSRFAAILFANFYTALGCVMILCALFNMHCKSCCTCTCAQCDGVPEPYPLLAYACDTQPLCKFKPKKCGTPPPGIGNREESSWDDDGADARI